LDEIGTEGKLDEIGGAKVKMYTPVHGLSGFLAIKQTESPCPGVHIFTFASVSAQFGFCTNLVQFQFSTLNKLFAPTTDWDHNRTVFTVLEESRSYITDFTVGFSLNPVSITLPYYDKVPETKKLFSLFCTVFAIWKHLEAFVYWLFSLLCTDFAIWKHLEAYGYWMFSLFCTVLTQKRQVSENSKTSKWFQKWLFLEAFGEAHCFRWFVFSVSKRCKIAKPVSIQMLPNASK
jgi:hypothetical protein